MPNFPAYIKKAATIIIWLMYLVHISSGIVTISFAHSA